MNNTPDLVAYLKSLEELCLENAAFISESTQLNTALFLIVQALGAIISEQLVLDKEELIARLVSGRSEPIAKNIRSILQATGSTPEETIMQ